MGFIGNNLNIKLFIIICLLIGLIGCGNSDTESLIGCGNSDTESLKKIDINKLPSWFTLDEEIDDKEKAEEFIKFFEAKNEHENNISETNTCADSFVIVGDNAKAASLYLEVYRQGLEMVEKLLQDGSDSDIFAAAYVFQKSMDNLAKAQYIGLFIYPEMPIKELYAYLQINEQNLNMLKLSVTRSNRVIFNGNTILFPEESAKELGITKNGAQSLLDVNAIIEYKIKKLRYSLEDF